MITLSGEGIILKIIIITLYNFVISAMKRSEMDLHIFQLKQMMEKSQFTFIVNRILTPKNKVLY